MYCHLTDTSIQGEPRGSGCGFPAWTDKQTKKVIWFEFQIRSVPEGMKTKQNQRWCAAVRAASRGSWFHFKSPSPYKHICLELRFYPTERPSSTNKEKNGNPRRYKCSDNGKWCNVIHDGFDGYRVSHCLVVDRIVQSSLVETGTTSCSHLGRRNWYRTIRTKSKITQVRMPLSQRHLSPTRREVGEK